jgi:hypothetical protein
MEIAYETREVVESERQDMEGCFRRVSKEVVDATGVKPSSGIPDICSKKLAEGAPRRLFVFRRCVPP